MTIEIKTVAVGSMNPVKETAVRQTVTRVWPTCVVRTVDVPSGVSEMPFGEEETITGARNRATAALRAGNADMGVGLEGGVVDMAEGLMMTGWVVAVLRDGREGVGGAARIPLPPWVAERIRSGEELGPVMNAALRRRNVSRSEGTAGVLTANLVDRTQVFATAVAYALGPFVAADIYAGDA